MLEGDLPPFPGFDLEKLVSHYGERQALKVMAKFAGYVDVPPTIDEFIEDSYFCGDFLGGGMLYPTWNEYLKQIFPNEFNSSYIEVAVTGSIGCGKTIFCCAGALYDLCKLLYLDKPQEKFGLLPTKPISLGCINTTLSQSQAVIYNTLIEWINTSPFFKAQQKLVHQPDRRKKKDLLPNKIGIIMSSRGNQVLGQDLFGAILSELNFQGAAVKDQAVQNFTQVSHRITSRFNRGENAFLPGRLWLDSSKSDETGWLENHIKDIASDPEHNLIICEAIWKVKERAGVWKGCGEYFKVFIGDQNRDPFILDGPGASLNIPNELLVDVPVEYRYDFERNLIGSLQNMAGVSTWGSNRFMSQEALVKKAMRTDGVPTPNACRKEVVTLDFEDEDDQLINYIDLDLIPKEGTYFIHFDIGVKRDRTGIALTRSLGEVVVDRHVSPLLSNVMTRDLIFQTPMVAAVVARPGQEVPLSKLRNFVMHLIERGINVVGVSCDQYQSTEMLQQARKAGLMAELVSVDRTRAPYDYLKDCILERRWTGPYHEILERELLNLRDEGKKIDHPVSDGSVTIDSPSKDIADAVAGSVFFCKEKSISGKANQAFEQYFDHLKANQRKVGQQEVITNMLGMKPKRGNKW